MEKVKKCYFSSCVITTFNAKAILSINIKYRSQSLIYNRLGG